MRRRVDVELYAGAGGTSEGARRAGAHAAGIEIDADACATAAAAGHLRVQADVAAYPTGPFAGRCRLLLASPPCQGWSQTGRRLGELDRDRAHDLVEAYAAGVGEHAWQRFAWADDRSHHVAQPVRWIHDLRPEAVFLEQVPPVLPLWRHIARVLAGWGYAVWCGRLNSADFGVPQTRVRAILLASRVRRVVPPAPTHYDPRRGTAMLGQPWVSMAEALGWGPHARPAPTVTGGGTGSGGGVEVFAGAYARNVVRTNCNRSERGGGELVTYERDTDRPAPTILSSTGRWTLVSAHRAKREDRTRPRTLDEPAHTVAFGHSDMRWTLDRPATTVAGDPRVPAPGHRDRAGGERQHTDSVKVSVAEAALLQGFPAGYPWRGSRTSQYQQIGNAVPPPLAEACVRQIIGEVAGG